MIKFKLIYFCIIFLVVGCAKPQLSIHKKPGVDFLKHKKLAVLKFTCKDTGIGQEVSDLIAMEFMKKGYDVVERSQLQAIIDENAIINAGLTDTSISELKLKGINTIVNGAVTRYDCQQRLFLIPTQYGSAGGSKEQCHVSLSLKMLDVKSGEVIWATQASHSLRGKNMTAGQVMSEIMEKLERELPQ